MTSDLSASSARSPHVVVRSSSAALIFVLLTAAFAMAADAVRVTADRAIVWNRPGGVSVIVTQLAKGDVVEVIRKVDDWYEIVIPGREQRTGFVRASQVEFVAGAAPQRPAGTAPIRRAPGAAAKPKVPRTFVTIDGGYRTGGTAFTRTVTAFATRFAEPGTIDADYGKGSGFVFDATGGYRFTSHVGFALGLSSYARNDTVAISARVPHPLYFNQFREATFDDSTPKGRETAFHASLTLTTVVAKSTDLTFFAGPSVFNLSQDVVTDLTLADAYPYDQTSIVGTVLERKKGTPFGFHVGVDLTRYINPNTGFGVSARFSRAALSFKDDDGATNSGHAGGPQISAGLRFKF